MKQQVAKSLESHRESNDHYLVEIETMLKQIQDQLMTEKQLEKSLTEELGRLENEFKQVVRKYKEAEQEKNIAKNKFESIQRRRSWRYTTPVRKLFDLLKSVIRLFKNQDRNVSSSAKEHDEKKTKNKRNKLKITQLKHRLYGLGFTERALTDLQDLANSDTDPALKKLAAWELALFYANQYNEEGARKCLELLPIALQGTERNRKLLRQAAIEAECYEILGDIDKAKQIILQALEIKPEVSLYLSAANLETSESAKLEWINKALRLHGIAPITLLKSTMQPAFDRLISDKEPKKGYIERNNTPKVSVIMPVYNAEDVVQTSLKSVLSQTWTNIEVIIVDDCSTDSTVEVVGEYVTSDSRVKLIKAESNGGTYVARNLGLRVATGDFVTCHDADDWSHPEKIEKQVLHLMGNSSVIGNYSQAVRATEDLRFFRRSKPKVHIFTNTSSFMFRRKPVMKAIGYWDCVRFSSDSEFLIRIAKEFGKEALVELPTGPLSFARQSRDSLTGNEAFGYHGYKMGARKEYTESYHHFHANTESLRYDFPQKARPFPVPDPMLPKRVGYRHFDVIFVSDFRLEDSNIITQLEDIKKRKGIGICAGLIQMSRYDVSPSKQVNSRIREVLDGEQIQMVVYGEKVSCDILVVTDFEALQEWQRFIPTVEAKNIHVILNKKPQTNNKQPSYNLNQCKQHLQQYFGKSGVWHPVSPLVRKELHWYHEHELASITLSNEDWSNSIVEQLLKGD